MSQAPVMVLNQNTQRETGRTAQLSNIRSARAISDIVRTTLGPRSMLKMLLDPMGGIVMSNDGNSILREVDVSHPAAKSMIELSRSQDEEAGDGTTTVIVLAGEALVQAEQFLERNVHPTVIVRGYNLALQAALRACDAIARPIDVADTEAVRGLIETALGTKFSGRWGDVMVNMALQAVRKVSVQVGTRTEVDIKRFAKVEKIPGGEISDCVVLDGVVFNKDVTHSRMRRRIENPRVLLLDCPLEYKKGESQAQVELTNEEDFAQLLRLEEQYVEQLCTQILAFSPDIVITEKGLSDLAQHYFVKAGVTAFRRLRKSDNNRVARATGATIVSRPDEITESDIGTGCGLFHVEKIGDEYFTYLDHCTDPKACTLMLRGASMDVLREVERNLRDAMSVARNVVFEPRLLPGGGATEMAVASFLRNEAESVDGRHQAPFRAVAAAFEVIPRTLTENAGGNVIRTMTALRAKHAFGAGGEASEPFQNCNWGVNGETAELTDMSTIGVWEPYSVKAQTIKTAIESACMLLRIDDIVSGTRPAAQSQQGGGPGQGEED